MDQINALLAKVEDALQGEPARFIGYGAAIVVVGVVAIANALGVSRFGSNIDFTTALGLAGGALTALISVIESIRHFVYSPTTVGDILTEVAGDTATDVAPDGGPTV